MPKKSFRIALGIVVGTLVVGLLVAAVLVTQALDYPTRKHAGQGVEVEVEIEPGMSFPGIARRLEARGIIDNPRWFRLYAMHRGATTQVRAGRYTLRDDQTPEQVLDALLEGVKDVTVPVTIPEGLNFLEVFAILDAADIADARELEALCRDPAFLESKGITAPTCEGYLFPDTYRFRVPTPPVQVIERLMEQHRIVWDTLRQQHEQSLERLKRELEWSDHDVLTLASIVEKEAVAAQEQPRIAQVFVNRLTSPTFRPRKLETDPTIRYGCMVPVKKSKPCQDWDITQRLRRAQLDDEDNPYNTYQHEGLPPGPIANPGTGAMAAAMDPDGSRYFFFVSRNDGTHVFSKTVAEHERNVDKYQR